MNAPYYLFELSGEHPTLPKAEVLSCLQAECGASEVLVDGPGYSVCTVLKARLKDVAARLALCHRVGPYLGQCELDQAASFAEGLHLPSGSISVRVKRFQGKGSPEIARTMTKKLGAVLSNGRKVDLIAPDVKVRVLVSDRLQFFVEELQIDRDQFEARHVRSRPFFSPVSLHPRYARALVNLTQVKRGQSLLDPFCGTGGILLEASLIGAKALGSDISPQMIDGCKMNMSHFDADWKRLEVTDVSHIEEIFGKVDAVASDPPYGRSATTKKEPVTDLHTRAIESIARVLRPNSLAGVVFPNVCKSSLGLEAMAHHMQRVHRSLTRHYCVFKRC